MSKKILIDLLKKIDLEIEKRKKDNFDFKSREHFKVAIGLMIAHKFISDELKKEYNK